MFKFVSRDQGRETPEAVEEGELFHSVAHLLNPAFPINAATCQQSGRETDATERESGRLCASMLHVCLQN